MKLLLPLLCVLGVPRVSPVLHSLKYVYTASSQVPNFPEFVAVGLLDEVQMVYYDSDTQRIELKQAWVRGVIDEDPEYLEGQTELFTGHQQIYKVNVEIAKQRFNQTGGVHIVQWVYGCEWDDQTGVVEGFNQHGYDGEDFIALDLSNMRAIAAKQQAILTKNKWDGDRALLAYWRNYHTEVCPKLVKKHLRHGSHSLMRTEFPTVSLLQRTPSSPVTCHATGFYPARADLFWRRGDEELHEGVAKGELLPNHDGTFQMSVDLDLGVVEAGAWASHSCVFQLDGVNAEVATILDRDVIRTNWGQSGNGGLVAGVVVGVLSLLAAAAVGFFLWKRNNRGFQRTNTSGT